MRWQLLDRITELFPGKYAGAESSTNFPAELFADHFPSYPITPGVLIIEMGAQLAGLLVQATVLDDQKQWIYPLLGMVQDAKFRHPVPPYQLLRIGAQLETLRPEAAVCAAQIFRGETCCANMRLMLVFESSGDTRSADPDLLQKHARNEFDRLGAPWQPPAL